MSPRPHQLRQITCEVCGRQRRAEQKDRDICRDCLRKEPSLAMCALQTDEAPRSRGDWSVPTLYSWLLDRSGYALAAHGPKSSTTRMSSCARPATTWCAITCATRTSRSRSRALSAGRYAIIQFTRSGYLQCMLESRAKRPQDLLEVQQAQGHTCTG